MLIKIKIKKKRGGGGEGRSQVRWLMLVILATWEAEIGRIAFQGQTEQIIRAKWTGHGSSLQSTCLQVQSPKFKLQSHQKKKR
jgi:hypothetical protein